MRTRWIVLGVAFATACFEGGEPGERWVDPACDECEPPSCPEGEACAEDAPGLRFRGSQVRLCTTGQNPFAALFAGPAPIAVGGRSSLWFWSLTARDAEPGAITVATDLEHLSASGLELEGHQGTVRLDAVAPGVTTVSVRRVEGDLLIDRISMTAMAAASVRLAPPSQFGCALPGQVLYRSLERAPVVEVLAADGSILVDEAATVTLEDGAPLGPIAAGIDRVALAVEAAGSSWALELDVVDSADRVERADPARDLIVDPRGGHGLPVRCFRASHEGREVIGAAFELSVETARGHVTLSPLEGSPQCIESALLRLHEGGTLHVRAAGAERTEVL